MVKVIKTNHFCYAFFAIVRGERLFVFLLGLWWLQEILPRQDGATLFLHLDHVMWWPLAAATGYWP